jgi:hypothetical protein
VFDYLFTFAKKMQDEGLTASSVAMASGAMIAAGISWWINICSIRH